MEIILWIFFLIGLMDVVAGVQVDRYNRRLSGTPVVHDLIDGCMSQENES